MDKEVYPEGWLQRQLDSAHRVVYNWSFGKRKAACVPVKPLTKITKIEWTDGVKIEALPTKRELIEEPHFDPDWTGTNIFEDETP